MDSGHRNIYGVLKDFYPACLSIMIVRELTTSFSVERLVLVARLYIGNSWKIGNVSGLVLLKLGTAKGPNTTIKIFVGII